MKISLEGVKTLVKSKAYQGQFLVKKRSPEILLIVGLGGFGTSMWLACRATLKAQPVLKHARDVADALDVISSNVEEPVEKQEMLQARMLATVDVISELAQLYGPAIVIGGLSVGCLIGSNRILTRRNAAIAGAYTLIDGAFKGYRARVKTELGEDVDTYLMWKKPLEEKMKVVPASRKVNPVNFDDMDFNDLPGEVYGDTEDQMGMPSPYAKIFNEDSIYWRRDRNMNEFFLRAVQTQMNDELHARGNLFLNEVYDALGIPRTESGAIVGWLSQGGDCFVDFDLYNPYNQSTADFVNGYEHQKGLVLDFNVDGPIFNMLS